MMPCLYDEKQHQLLPDGDLIRHCKKITPAKDKERLFLYRHRLHGTFVIGMWAGGRAMGIFTDFLNLGKSLGNVNTKTMTEFRRRMYAPTSPKEISDALNESDRQFNRDRQAEDEEVKEIKQRYLAS
jgi:hypothetical protein